MERYTIHLEVPHPITYISFSLPAKGRLLHITENLHGTLQNHFFNKKYPHYDIIKYAQNKAVPSVTTPK